MSNETKIGILAVVTIALFIFGFKFIKGQNILTTSNLIYVKYEKVEMLAVSSPVTFNGFQIGVVSDIYINPDDMRTIIAILDVDNDIKIHKAAVAEIVDASLMGGKAVRIVNNTPCSGADCVESGDYIAGRTVGMLQAMLPKDDLQGYMVTLKDNIGPVVDTLSERLNNEEILLGRILLNLEASMKNLQSTTDRLNRLMAASSGSLSRTLTNLESITGNVASSNARITSLLDNADGLMTDLNQADFGATIDSARMMLATTGQTMTRLQQTLQNVDSTLSEYRGLANRINEGEGALAMLANDPEFAERLNKTVTDLDALLSDFRDHPYNYMPLKSRKKVKKWRAKDQQEGN